MKLKSLLLASCMMASATGVQAMEMKTGDIIIRARALGVVPDEDATVTGAVTGNTLSIDNSVVPEVDFSYFVTPNIAFELIAAVTPHNVKAPSSSAGPLGLGDSWLLPPTLTAQYHFTDMGKFKPYVGVGINYTHFSGKMPERL